MNKILYNSLVDSFKHIIRQIVREELARQTPSGTDSLVSLVDFCKEKKISRITIWRAEKRGEIKLTRIGTLIYINMRQFDK